MTGTVASLFESCRALLMWAWEDIEEYAARWYAWVAAQPYVTFTALDPDTGDQLLKLRITDPVPYGVTKTANVAGGLIKHSIDQALFAATSAFLPNIKQTTFPWTDSPEGFEKRLDKNLPAQIQAVLREFKPYRCGAGYEGGDDILRDFAAVVNSGKHNVHTAVYQSLMPNSVIIRGNVGKVTIGNEVGKEKHGEDIIFGRILAGGDMQFDDHFAPTFNLIFFKPGSALHERSVIEVLSHAATRAEALILELENVTHDAPQFKGRE